MKESDFQRKLIAYFKDIGAFYFNAHGHAMQKAGMPDLYVASKLFEGWLELKVNRGKPTPLQVSTMRDLRRSNVPTFIVRFDDKTRAVSIEDLDGKPFMVRDLDNFQHMTKDLARCCDRLGIKATRQES
jgi:hypothetical protein